MSVTLQCIHLLLCCTNTGTPAFEITVDHFVAAVHSGLLRVVVIKQDIFRNPCINAETCNYDTSVCAAELCQCDVTTYTVLYYTYTVRVLQTNVFH